MANLNSLPHLSTVDIEAIQDSGPILPRPSLPPLTTIAENWDSIDPLTRCLAEDEDSNSDDSSDGQEDRLSHSGIPKKANLPKTCSKNSSRSSSSECDSDDSDSDVSTDDTGESSSCSSDSESDTQSSGSSCSTRSDVFSKHQSRDRSSFSVREANFDKGRVTLRLSSLQLSGKQKHDHKKQDAFKEIVNSRNTDDTDVVDGTCGRTATQKVDVVSKSKSRIQELSPSKTSHSQIVSTVNIKPNLVKSKAETLCSNSNSGKAVSSSSSSRWQKSETVQYLSADVKPPVPLNSHSQAATSPSIQNTAPSLSDLDSDSEELCLPSVSEAIRMLELDTQVSPSPAAPPPSAAPAAGTSLLEHCLPLLGCLSSPNDAGTLEQVGYCSSLLKKLVAKSQSGEPLPPLPPPPVVPP